ncbi:carbohydrate ABC transporter permease [Devosia oryziradicis]|uniref:Carbohydrate ABC transporter permease n=1 Tax=Devosia oryziradicis TaxID=2801335 RepID=A0ABX7C0G2_9HYPH|nr:carbohydrate ABC transporter permease [Devosia oryziradicis]QQR36744.1 carbohydrate ABC transporter permease [Devosia oryziradicis]
MKLDRILGNLVLAIFGFIALFPLVWTALNAFKKNVDIISKVPKFFFTPTLENVTYVLGRHSVMAGLTNSIIACGTSVLVGVVLGLPLAYAIARYPNKWSADIQFFVLSIRFLPPVAVAIPLMVIWLQIGLYDSLVALIVTYSLITISVTVWLSIPAFQRVPKEVEEAGFVDGYGAYAVFWKVALPVALRSLVGAIAFSFVLIWNEFLMALMLSSTNAKTLPIVASELSQQGMNVPWGILNASVVLLSLPPLLFLGVLSGFLSSAFTRRT